MAEQGHPGDEWLRKVAQRLEKERAEGATPNPVRLPVREFLAKFGKAKRGRNIVSSIRLSLEDHRLRTTPDFENEYIDDEISIELDDNDRPPDQEVREPSPTVRVGSLAAANKPPVRVTPDDELVKATTIMLMDGYSQLPVMTTEREVKGIISWRSLGEALADGAKPEWVRDCMEEARIIDTKTTLAEATYEILNYDYVLVRKENNIISGIVTAADLADQFRQLAHPFLLIGEIEHHLRNLVVGRFTAEDFRNATEGREQVRGAGDLTFGDYCRLLERPDSWNKLNLKLDRVEFIRRLERTRQIRNDVMHFSPDGIEPEDVRLLEQIAEFLRRLHDH